MMHTQPDHRPLTASVRFMLLPLDSFALLALGGFIDKLRFTADEADNSEQRLCSWAIVGSTHSVRSSSGVTVNVDRHIDELTLSQYDYLVIFGSRTAQLALEGGARYGRWIKKVAAHRIPVVAVDNASFTLASLGLLDGHEVSVHWRHEQEFRTLFPAITVRSDKLFCCDGKRITCCGGSAAIDLAAELLSRHFDRSRALKGLADMLVDETREPLHLLRSSKDEHFTQPALNKAARLMRAWLAENQSVDDIANATSLSRRQLDRLFTAETGKTAHQYWMEMKMQYVYWRLCNSSHRLSAIAGEVAIQDVSYLSALVLKRFGVRPNALRNGKLN